METLLYILVGLLVVLVVAGLYMMFKKDEPRVSDMSQAQVAATLVNVRNVKTPGGGTVKAVTFVINESTTVPYNVALEGPWDDDLTDLDIFRDSSRPMEERRAAAERLREVGYDIKADFFREDAPGSPAGGDASEDGGSGGDSGLDVESETDIPFLESFLANPYLSAEERERIGRRVAELKAQGAGTVPGEGDEGGEEDADGGGGEFVDPLDMTEPLDPQPDLDYLPAGGGDDPEPGPEPEAETVGTDGPGEGREYGNGPEDGDESVAEAAAGAGAGEETVRDAKGTGVAVKPVPSPLASRPAYYRGAVDGEDMVPMDFTEEYDDAADSMKAVRLMGFIARSFKERLITPELVLFAQRRLNLKVNPEYWTEEDFIRANARVGVYERNPEFVNMAPDEFDMYFRSVVANAEDSRAAEAAAAESAKEIMEGVAAKEGTAPAASADAERQEAPEGGGGNPAPEEAPAAGGDAVDGAGTEGGGTPAGPAPSAPEAAAPKSGAKAPGGVPPKKERTRPASRFFDSLGGRNDPMWERLK